jgi:hypothetical protein
MDGELRVVSEKLQHRFGVDGGVVDATIDREAERFSGVRVHAFVPLLVERAARRSLARRYHCRR